jgi:hypothetical protein
MGRSRNLGGAALLYANIVRHEACEARGAIIVKRIDGDWLLSVPACLD